MTDKSGRLYLCPTPIGNLEDISMRVLRVLRECDVIACEDTRHTLKLLNHFEIKNKLTSYHEHNKDRKKHSIAQKVRDGQKVALVTDAGMPGISDPGEDMVKLCIEENLPFEVLPGPSAFVNALVASGLSSRRFVFEGFLDRNKKERNAALERIAGETRTTIIYEAPHRLKKTLLDLQKILGERECVLCRELTKRYEEHIRGNAQYLISHYESLDPRGEYVLVIEGGRQAKKECTDDMIKDLLNDCARQGMRNKEAVKFVAEETGVSRNRIYSLSIKTNR
ncbi:MAG: 16S rRNA (cytidine(1402)-2'-O)-methyltransferase [Clostridiales bacterium]|nr:MAG: 16S rRNA (cytidine(1402)-2'-O)-methyltransferase [Clostridiales bacterium]